MELLNRIKDNRVAIKIFLLLLGNLFIFASMHDTSIRAEELNTELDAILLEANLNSNYYSMYQDFRLTSEILENQEAILKEIAPNSSYLATVQDQNKDTWVSAVYYLYMWSIGDNPSDVLYKEWNASTVPELKVVHKALVDEANEAKKSTTCSTYENTLSQRWTTLNGDKDAILGEAVNFQFIGVVLTSLVLVLEIIWR